MIDTPKKDGSSALIFDIPISGRSESQVLNEIQGWIVGGDRDEHKTNRLSDRIRLIFTPNSEILTLAARDGEFRSILQSADMNIPDGVGLVLADKIFKRFRKNISDQTISRSLTGTDLGHSLVMLAAEKGWRVFYLGGLPSVADAAGVRLEIEAKESGRVFSPDFSWKSGRPEDEQIIEKINGFAPDILLVALGQGKQERWLYDHKDQLKVKVGMVVGGAVDFWSGRVSRAPRWMRKIGLEWLYRLLVEPWRWRRQLKLIEFGWLVFKESLK